MKIRLLIIAAAAIVISSCSKTKDELLPASSTTSSTTSSSSSSDLLDGARKVGRPFRGSLVYNSTTEFDLPCECGEYAPVGNYFGVGELTELGRTTSKIKPCASLIITGGSVTGEHVGVECATFRSACGDELYVSTHPYDIIFTAAGPVGTATVDIIGGTGRFRHATGSFTGTVTLISATESTFTDIKGTIYY